MKVSTLIVLFLAVLQCGRAERMWRSIGLKEELEMLVGNGTAPFLLPPKPPTSNLRSASAVFGAAANCRFGPSSRYWKRDCVHVCLQVRNVHRVRPET
jgi:hypothetical protein